MVCGHISTARGTPSKRCYEGSIPSAGEPTELEKAAKEYGDNFYCEEVNPEEAFIKGVKWLAEKLWEKQVFLTCPHISKEIERLTKGRE